MEPRSRVLVGALLRRRHLSAAVEALIRMLLGIALLGNAVNLLIFTGGRLTREVPPIIPAGLDLPAWAGRNPLPQALILTAIVIAFSFFAFLLVLAFRAYQELGTDNTDACGRRAARRALRRWGTDDGGDRETWRSAGGDESLRRLRPRDWLVILPVVLAIGRRPAADAPASRALAAGIALAGSCVLAATPLLFARVAVRWAAGHDHGQLAAAVRHLLYRRRAGRGFALVAALVALLRCLYRQGDIDAIGGRDGFYPFLMLLMAGVSGAFLTGDLFNLYVWFEVMLIASFGLLVLGSRAARSTAR